MSSNVFRLLADLASKDAPQVLYSYKIRPLSRAGALSLCTVLAIYGLSFADVSKLSASLQYNGVKEDKKKDALFLMKIYGPIGMTILPLSISLGSLYVLSRTVTKVKYIPQINGTPKCEITRGSAILGRDIKVTRLMNRITKSRNVRIYTGQGPQGIDDKSSFSFYLMDRDPAVKNILNKLYILPRSGKVWNSDGRVLSALFGGDDKGHNVLFNEGTQGGSKNDENINMIQKNIILQEMMKLNKSSKVKFHSKKATSQSELVRDIVNSNKNRK